MTPEDALLFQKVGRAVLTAQRTRRLLREPGLVVAIHLSPDVVYWLKASWAAEFAGAETLHSFPVVVERAWESTRVEVQTRVEVL